MRTSPIFSSNSMCQYVLLNYAPIIDPEYFVIQNTLRNKS